MTSPPTALTPPAIVVGVDGSPAAQRAAAWAVDEAAGRELPLHLLAAYDGPASSSQAATAIRLASEVVAAAGRPVPLTSELVTGEPAAVLLAASASAVMLCVGATGLDPADHPVGSTVNALAASAHCPLVVVRGPVRRSPPGWVVAELDETSDSGAVLQYAVEEARLRGCPLRVLGTWQTDGAGGTTVTEGDRPVRAQLDRRLATWRHRYPDLDVQPVAVPGSGLHYLAAHGPDIALIVVGARNVIAVNELLGPAGRTALADSSLLILDSQRLL